MFICDPCSRGCACQQLRGDSERLGYACDESVGSQEVRVRGFVSDGDDDAAALEPPVTVRLPEHSRGAGWTCCTI